MVRLGCTGPPWFSWDDTQKRYEEARWSTCAGLQLNWLTSYRGAEKPKMVSTSSSSPIRGLRPRIRGWSTIFTRPASGSSFALGGARVSFENSFDSKQPKLEPKLVSALSETKRLFRLLRFYTETESFDVSIEPKQTEGQPKQFDGEHIFHPNLWV